MARDKNNVDHMFILTVALFSQCDIIIIHHHKTAGHNGKDYQIVYGGGREKHGTNFPFFLYYMEESHFSSPHYQSVIPKYDNDILRHFLKSGGYDVSAALSLPEQPTGDGDVDVLVDSAPLADEALLSEESTDLDMSFDDTLDESLAIAKMQAIACENIENSALESFNPLPDTSSTPSVSVASSASREPATQPRSSTTADRSKRMRQEAWRPVSELGKCRD